MERLMIKFLLNLMRKQTQNLLKEGYHEMYSEAKRVLKDFESLDRESMNYVD